MADTTKKPGSNRLRKSKVKPQRPTKSTAEPAYGQGKKPKPFARYGGSKTAKQSAANPPIPMGTETPVNPSKQPKGTVFGAGIQ